MPGHVFVVHGRTEALVKDAVVVTTDADLTLEPHWRPVVGDDDPAALRPADWGRNGRLFGAAPGRQDLWFLNVSDAPSLDRLHQALAETIEAVARSGLRASAGRALPLVAIPVPGIGGGGFANRAGAVIAGMLRTLAGVVARHDVDVVVVATTRGQFAAIERVRRLGNDFPLAPELLRTAELLGEAAASGALALFLGAGVSIPAGLPSWTELVDEIRATAVAEGADIPQGTFAALGVLDQTELLRGLLGERLEAMVVQRFRNATPALSHALLASLQTQEVVTTNYDQCYETAVAAQEPHTRPAVMPWEKPRPGTPWLLKLHGDADRPGSVVLTRGQFIGYDARWRPVGSVFQSLLMTRQLLVVGASLSDDNVLRLAHEVRALRREHQIDDLLGHVLTLGPPPLRARLWEGELEWVSFAGGTDEEQARRLEIFLDAVAAHACRTTPYLLHPDYADLLDGGEELADLARELAGRIAKGVAGSAFPEDSGWAGLLTALEGWGVERH